MFAIAGIVLVITMGARFSGYLTDAAAGFFTKEVLLMIMFYKLPNFLELIMPVSFFLALMLTYGRLHTDSEMVVLECCGMSSAKFMGITLVLSLLVVMIVAILSLWLKPLAETKSEQMFADQRNLTEFDTLGAGRFQSLYSGRRVTYTESLGENGSLKNVFINEYKSGNIKGAKDVVTVVAESGDTMVDANGNRMLVLKNGTRHSGMPGAKNYQVIRYSEFGQFIQKEKTEARYPRRQGLSTLQLMADKTPRNASELQWRFSIVIMIPILAVLAIPLSRVSPRQGRFTRLLPAMTLCFLYIFSLSAARSAVEKGEIPVGIGIWWVHGLYILLIYALYNMSFLLTPLQWLRSKRASVS